MRLPVLDVLEDAAGIVKVEVEVECVEEGEVGRVAVKR